MPLQLRVDGLDVEIADDGASLLEVLRDRLGLYSPKDGCSPQGQCGCCTVLVDGQPRVACVTPARRVAGRTVTTLDGIDPDVRDAWADAFTAAGASQCGFCTPGIMLRLVALAERRQPVPLEPADVKEALLAHLCRCTGWQTIVEAATRLGLPADSADPAGGRGHPPRRDWAAAGARASLEGGVPQRVGPTVTLGRGGFAEDTAPTEALVAVPDGEGGWVVGDTLAAARQAAGNVPGRRTTLGVRPALDLPPGDWELTLQTTWVEPAYLEPDASWCRPGGEPASSLANGGAFGAKGQTGVAAAARMLADRHQRPVRVVLAREDVVRLGPKRPPVAAGVADDGSGMIRVVRTSGIASAIEAVAPSWSVQEVDCPGPPTSAGLRAAGWAEVAVLLACWRASRDGGQPVVVAPNGAVAWACFATDGVLRVGVSCGPPLDETVLRSYAIGAAHQAVGWVTSEGLAVDGDGQVHDLTIRSFGVLRASDTPPIEVSIVPPGSPVPGGRPTPDHAVNGSDAVFAAAAAAVWMAGGLCPQWPTHRRSSP